MKERLYLIDSIRGAAIVGVVIFHLVWDLEFAGLISGIAFHPVWLAYGKLLAGTFMVLVGVGLVLAHKNQIRIGAFLWRLAVIAAAAVGISVVTWFAIPSTFIFFGILHSIAVASVIGLIFLRLPVVVILLAGLIVVASPHYFTSPLFDTRWLAWIGFSEAAPRSNDFVPIFPWAGLTLVGITLAKIVIERRLIPPGALKSAHSPVFQLLSWFGRKSLLVYLIHQPLLLAIILPLSGYTSNQ